MKWLSIDLGQSPKINSHIKKIDVRVTNSLIFILPDLYRASGDRVREQEGLQMHNNFNQTLLKDNFMSNQLPEHSLIFWTDGPLPTTEALKAQAAARAGTNASASTSSTSAT